MLEVDPDAGASVLDRLLDVASEAFPVDEPVDLLEANMVAAIMVRKRPTAMLGIDMRNLGRSSLSCRCSEDTSHLVNVSAEMSCKLLGR